MTAQRSAAIDVSQQLVLSLFPGIDMLGRGFEDAGFCIVRGPDLIFGGDIYRFHAPAGRFDGVVGGSPCQDFSRARRDPPTGQGQELLQQFARVVRETAPAWWLLENVPGVPKLAIEGYSYQHVDLDARDFGLKQMRLRYFQFGHREGRVLVMPRPARRRDMVGEATCTATEGQKPTRRGWGDYCELQGLPRDFKLPSFTRSASYRAVGNGVPPIMGRRIAQAINTILQIDSAARLPLEKQGTVQPLIVAQRLRSARLCGCGCARPVIGNQTYAGAACRKREQRRRDAAETTERRPVTKKSDSRRRVTPP